MNTLELMKLISEHGTTALMVGLGVSEALALIPGIRANSVFQLVFNGLKRLAGK